ncbi:MAG: hypothetical protein NTX50_32085, partial [Candidatus Sumerlaeota bacterium]|nr:hypothetical protein [Candidatus Sumerlaeota bacterium]
QLSELCQLKEAPELVAQLLKLKTSLDEGNASERNIAKGRIAEAPRQSAQPKSKIKPLKPRSRNKT